MAPTWFVITLESSIIAIALVAGVFLTFSEFVMRSLAAAQPAGGIEAMQIINRKVYRSVFMVLLLGMSALSPLLAGYAYLNLSGPVSDLIIAGGALYFFGVFVVSMVFNVPMNRRLDAMAFSGAEAATYWTTYVPSWSFWNYVRALTAAGSAICFLVASVWLAAG